MTSAPVPGQLAMRMPFEFEEDVEIIPREPPASLGWLDGVVDHLERILGGPRPRIEWFEQPAESMHRCGFKLGGFYRNGDSAIWVNIDRRVPGLLVQTVTHEYIHYQRWRDGIRCPHRPGEGPCRCEDEVVDDLAWDIAPMDLVPSFREPAA